MTSVQPKSVNLEPADEWFGEFLFIQRFLENLRDNGNTDQFIHSILVKVHSETFTPDDQTSLDEFVKVCS
jgi:predicted metal-dependent phosphotriesterase family hydrolase